jgi:hypothetical protein
VEREPQHHKISRYVAGIGDRNTYYQPDSATLPPEKSRSYKYTFPKEPSTLPDTPGKFHI